MEKLRDVFTKFTQEKRFVFLANFTFITTIIVTFVLTLHSFAVSVPSRWLVLGLMIYVSILCTIYYFKKVKTTVIFYFIGMTSSFVTWSYLRQETSLFCFVGLFFIISSFFLDFKFTTGLFLISMVNFGIIALLIGLSIFVSPLGTMQLELMSIVHFPVFVVGYLVSYFVGKLLFESYNTQQEQLIQLKNTQDQLINQEKLESIRMLAGGVAHDFNNLLTAILGNINLASAEISSDNPIYELIKEAEIASIQARELTTQLLEFSKDTKPISMVLQIPLLLEKGSSLGSSGSNVKVEIQTLKNLWNVKGNPTQLTQVFHNLTTNSRDAMPEGGILKIIAINRHIKEKNDYRLKEGDYIQIQFVDSGTGIEPELVDKVFAPFFTTKPEEKGHGLGLAICQTIIQNHNGTISLVSEKGKGTVFEIFIPRYEESS